MSLGQPLNSLKDILRQPTERESLGKFPTATALLVIWSSFVVVLFLSRRDELKSFGPRVFDDLTNIFLLALILAIIYSLGRTIFSLLLRTHSHGPGTPNYLFCIGLGFGSLSLILFVLGAFKLYYPVTGYAILGLGGLLALRVLGRAKILSTGRAASHRFSYFEMTIITLITSMVLLALGCALVPPFLGDDMVYHLNTPKIYIKSHGLADIPHNVYTYFPMGTEMVYVLAMLVKGDILAKLVHWALGVLLILAVLSFSRQLGLSRRQALLAAAVFCTVPTVWILMAWSAYVDLALTFFIVLTVFALLNSLTCNDHRWLVVVGATFGFALATKFTALYLLPILFFGLLLRFRSKWGDAPRDVRSLLRPLSKEVLLPLLLSLLVASPWYVKNLYYTGNPFFPFFLNVFPVRHAGWDVERANLYLMWLGRYGSEVKSLGDYLRLPWSLTMNANLINPRAYDGILGPLFLITLPALILRRKLPPIAKVLLAFSFLYFLVWAFSTQQMRFLVPALPFLSIAAGLSLDAEPGNHARAPAPAAVRLKKAFIGLLLIALLGNSILIAFYFVKVDPLPYLWGFENRSEYLTKLLDYYALYEDINKNLPEKSKVFMINMGNFGYYLERDYFSDSIVEDHTLTAILDRSTTAYDVLKGVEALGVTHLLYHESFLLGTQYNALSEENRKKFIEFLKRHCGLVRSYKAFRLWEIRNKG